MVRRKFLWILGLGALAILALFWLLRKSVATSERPTAIGSNPPSAIAESLPLTNLATAPSPMASNSKNPSFNYTNSQPAKTRMDEAVMSAWMEQNKKPQDLYGRVVDQNSNPIPGAVVSGKLIFNTETYGAARVEVHTTETDTDGLFQFIGLQSAAFSASVEKPGYKWGAKEEGYKGPTGEKTSPTDRATFVMWKSKGAEPLQHTGIESRIPYDGTSSTFSMADGTKAQDGDLRVTLSRSPLRVRRGREPYDWKVKIGVIGGGLMEANDPYMFWAPENGYQPVAEFGMSATDASWSPEFRRNYYFKDSKGRFGRILVDLVTNSTRPDTGIVLEIWLNLSGSQNLELDSSH